MNKTLCLALILFAFGLNGCANQSGKNNGSVKQRENSEQGFYQSAQKMITSGQFLQAADKLQALEARYPFGRYAQQAQLELIYVHFRNLDYLESTIAAERFIRLHPDHPQLDYAYYVKGLAAFHMDQGIFDRFVKKDLSQRDTGAARQSFEYFNDLINVYPNSPYVADARARMIYLRNLLAKYEVNVGQFYMRRQAYLAAANRGQYIVENFQQTPSVGDGLTLMVQAYRKLGLITLADNALAVLTHNYPNHPSLDDGQDVEEYRHIDDDNISWLNLVTFGLFG
ncbi:MAG: outer membrane protein assembly factor BamD [Gammaproteobacteria bacterium]|nr:MAG: outer membrane protein assembly factor BamD [Gammaproteobacteria bacterium]